ncbi:DUF6177 family protein [Spirillospora sp. CA-294931]|uniref:DUF6177 family protein n=1 Tax=Spirillospora sp. CA-294931 TaxID=3240042 RepID=UPI003D8C440A
MWGVGMHPGVDFWSERALVMVQHRPLVSLSSWVADVFRVCGEREFQLLTSDSAFVTMPLRLGFGQSMARWVVRTPESEYFDGVSGVPLVWDESAFVPVEGKVRPAVDYEGTQLVVRVTVRHEAREPVLGEVSEVLCSVLADGAPVGWGTSEPAANVWRPGDLSEVCRARAPEPTWLVFVGESGVVGTIEVVRAVGGLEETVTCAVGYEGDVPDLGELVEWVAGRFEVVSLTAQVLGGRSDLAVGPLAGPPRPVGVAVGQAGVQDLGDLEGARLVGAPGRPVAWFEVGDGRSLEAWGPFLEVLARG